MRCTSYLFWSA